MFDGYREKSIKTAEREGTGEATGLVHGHIVPGQNIQEWRRLLRNCPHPYPENLGSKVLFITCQDQCFKVTKDDSEAVDDLTSSQEEADTRMLPGAVARSEASLLGMQAAPSSIPTSGTFFRGDLVMKTFLRPFSLFR